MGIPGEEYVQRLQNGPCERSNMHLIWKTLNQFGELGRRRGEGGWVRIDRRMPHAKDGCNLMGKQEERAATHTDNHGFQYVGVLPAWTTVEIRPDDTAEVHGR